MSSQDEQLDKCKEVVLSYLGHIGAKVEESNGVYTITAVPEKYRAIISESKRIAFSIDIAQQYDCSLVAPGDNFLARIIDLWRQESPVVSVRLGRRNTTDDGKDNTQDQSTMQLDTLPVRLGNGNIVLERLDRVESMAIRFYFLVTFQSIKKKVFLKAVTVELDTLNVHELSKGFLALEEEGQNDKIPFDVEKVGVAIGTIETNHNPTSIDNAYSTAREALDELFSNDIKLFKQSMDEIAEEQLAAIEKNERMQLVELDSEIRSIKKKIRDYTDRRESARTIDSKTRYDELLHAAKHDLVKANEKYATRSGIISSEAKREKERVRNRFHTIIESNLVGAFLIRFDKHLMDFRFENDRTTKTISAQYQPVVKRFLAPVSCDVCSLPQERLHLCASSHISCEKDSTICVDCDVCFCRNCIEKHLCSCNTCSKAVCVDCQRTCQFCLADTCRTHRTECSKCSAISCTKCGKQCEICSANSCGEHSDSCLTCKRSLCMLHQNTCSQCHTAICDSHTYICNTCQAPNCEVCTRSCGICQANVCAKHRAGCSSCFVPLCPSHQNRCERCSVLICEVHSTRCKICSAPSCANCTTECKHCQQGTCHNHTRICSFCKRAACLDHSSMCYICFKDTCSEHITTCGICGNSACERDTRPCASCSQVYCIKCMDEKCYTCSHLAKGSMSEMITRVVAAYDKGMATTKSIWFGENNLYTVIRYDSFLRHDILVIERRSGKIVHHKRQRF